MAHDLTLPDGRKLEYRLSGSADGFPLVYIHGTPGSYFVGSDVEAACARKGIKLITLNRAGYGGSSRQRGRTIVDVVPDIEALLQHLGLKECAVGGRSGGGPHTLAAAARLPGCLATLCVCGVAPYDAEGLDFFAGFGEDNIHEFQAALAGEEAVAKFTNAERPGLLAADPAGLVEQLASLLPEVDRKAILESEGVGEDFVQSFRESLKNSVDGWVDDDLAFTRPWGFEFSEIKVPVIVYHGDQDMMSPFSHGQWIVEHLPKDQVRPYLLQGEGHISIAHHFLDAMLDQVLAAAGQ
ncbi:hypothetical protein N0V82_004038 [Gnomoniopsis sp. IMI 355080]|nr:hypothetical protein N0V82_004038 [Gnomoniopsis sp. IMI 355080]